MNCGKTFDGCKRYDSIVHLTTQMQYIGMTGEIKINSGTEWQKETQLG